MVAIGNDRQFANFCKVLGLPDMPNDPRFATNRQRMAHKAEMLPVLQQALMARGARDWMDALNEIGVASGPINDFGAVAADPQVQHREIFRSLPRDAGEDVPIIANPIRLSDTPPSYRLPPPELGEHTQDVLRDWLGETR